MSDLRVNLDPNDINRVIAEAILNSAIGNQLRERITEQVKSLSVSWNNPITSVIQAEVRKLVVEMVQSRREEIAAAVAAQMTKEAIDNAVRLSVGKILGGRLADDF